jgi:signal transduction histidine kinase
LESYPSSIYPVFVNLVDNAIYWLQRNRGERTITLDADGADLLIRDNGPGVSIRDRENIFALNFSRKPGGRGMGLHISRETLARAGLKLDIDPRVEGEGATFRIAHSADARGKTGRKRK